MSFGSLLREAFVHHAMEAGAIAAALSGAVGLFVVVRGMSFAVHAVSELGFTGAAAALLLGGDPVLGLFAGSVSVGVALGLLSAEEGERDSAIGSFLAFGLGVGVLLISRYQGYATEATSLLFGSIVGVSARQVVELAAVAIPVGAVLVVAYRPVLFSSVDPQAAEARGVSSRVVSMLLLVLVGLASAEAVQVVGVLLVLTLVITPAAAAVRLTARPGWALALSVGIAVGVTEGGILLALATSAPATFFIAALSFAVYLGARVFGMDELGRMRRARSPAGTLGAG